MTMNVPDVGENLVLEMMVNKTAAQNLVLRLFQNNITPSDTDTAGTYTEATFPGYAAITLAGASWGAASAGSIAFAQQTFTISSGGPQTVFGYYYTQLTSGILVAAEAQTSFAFTNVGDNVKITPTITAN